MSKKKNKKVQTIKTVITKSIVTYFIPEEVPDTEVIGDFYYPTDEEVIDFKVTEEVK